MSNYIKKETITLNQLEELLNISTLYLGDSNSTMTDLILSTVLQLTKIKSFEKIQAKLLVPSLIDHLADCKQASKERVFEIFKEMAKTHSKENLLNFLNLIAFHKSNKVREHVRFDKFLYFRFLILHRSFSVRLMYPF